MLRSQRMLLVPHPAPNETFGSWFRGVAALHGVSREMLGRTLLAEAKLALPSGPIDWDLDPPQPLLALLQGRVMPLIAGRIAQMVPAGDGSHCLRPWERHCYCPTCWEEDYRHHSIHEERAGLSPYYLVCERHGRPLTAVCTPAERTLNSIYRTMLWDPPAHVKTTRSRTVRSLVYLDAHAYTSDTCAWMLRIQHRLDPWVSLPPRFEEEPAPDSLPLHSTVIEDLMMLAGCEVAGLTLLEWGRASWRRWVWRDDDGSVATPPRVWAPRGDIRLRQEAVRLAGTLWQWLQGELRFEPASDRAIYEVLGAVEVDSSAGRLIANTLARWPEPYRKLWRARFGGGVIRVKRIHPLGAGPYDLRAGGVPVHS